MASTDVTRYERKGRAAWITLDSPDNRNALTGPLLEQLQTRLYEAEQDPEARAIVLTGTGPAFCAGADLKARGGPAASGAPDAQQNPFVRVLRFLWDCPKPVIAAINGHAFGGGLGLVAAADVAIAVDGARFSFSEVRLGVIPAVISVVVLPKLGVHHATRLFVTGERFGAAEALQYGLLHRVVAADRLAAAVQDEVDAIALGGPIAVGEAKRLVRTVARMPIEAAWAHTEAKTKALFASEEAAEGIAAFAARRKPRWAE
jgi:methylglutaconyl-CoA hydratase